MYLKTLGGLLPVDVILRRVYDDDCDPLDLKVRRPWVCRAWSRPCGLGRSWWPTPWAAGSWKPRADGPVAGTVPRTAGGRAAAALGADLVVRCAEDWDYVRTHFDDLILRPGWPRGHASRSLRPS